MTILPKPGKKLMIISDDYEQSQQSATYAMSDCDSLVVEGRPVGKSTEIYPGNPFGLEGSADWTESRGRQAFDDVLVSILDYAGRDKETFMQLRDADEAIVLPMIHSERLRAQLRCETSPSGSSMISLTAGAPDTDRATKGFYMVQGVDGRVAIVHADIGGNQEWTPSSPEYAANTDAVIAYIDVYFEELDKMKSAEKLSAETPYELRRALGVRTIDVFNKEIELPRTTHGGQKKLRDALTRTRRTR